MKVCLGLCIHREFAKKVERKFCVMEVETIELWLRRVA